MNGETNELSGNKTMIDCRLKQQEPVVTSLGEIDFLTRSTMTEIEANQNVIKKVT